ncbi:MAG: hypothetical protein LBE21_02760 [Pseudomonadales bacterium]|jgi:hypothetical protein|nr:hypothetical protein [Pseudomonadales bacterium]
MQYEAVVERANKVINKAKPARLRQFAESALATLINDPTLSDIDHSGELNKDGLAAFHEARAGYSTATGKAVLAWVERIDNGGQFEGNMQAELLAAMLALEGWSEFLSGNVAGIEAIAEQLFEKAESAEPSSMSGPASAEVVAVYNKITAMLA